MKLIRNIKNKMQHGMSIPMYIWLCIIAFVIGISLANIYNFFISNYNDIPEQFRGYYVVSTDIQHTHYNQILHLTNHYVDMTNTDVQAQNQGTYDSNPDDVRWKRLHENFQVSNYSTYHHLLVLHGSFTNLTTPNSFYNKIKHYHKYLMLPILIHHENIMTDVQPNVSLNMNKKHMTLFQKVDKDTAKSIITHNNNNDE